MVEPIEAKSITDLPTMAKRNTDLSIVVEQKLKMAVRRGDILLVVLVIFGTLLLFADRSALNVKNSSAFDVVFSGTLSSNRLYFRGFRYINRVKFPVVKWLKHGHVVICLAEVSEMLCCGDVHPQPGPCISDAIKPAPAFKTCVKFAKTLNSSKRFLANEKGVHHSVAMTKHYKLKLTSYEAIPVRITRPFKRSISKGESIVGRNSSMRD